MSTCARSDCTRTAVFAVTDLRVEFEDPYRAPNRESESAGAAPRFAASYVFDGEPRPVCAEHLAEYIAVANDDGGQPVLAVQAADLGETHLIAEGFPDPEWYE